MPWDSAGEDLDDIVGRRVGVVMGSVGGKESVNGVELVEIGDVYGHIANPVTVAFTEVQHSAGGLEMKTEAGGRNERVDLFFWGVGESFWRGR